MNGFGGDWIWTAAVGGLLVLTILGSIVLLRRIRVLGTWMLCIGALMLALGQFLDSIRMMGMVDGGLLGDLPDRGQNVYEGILTASELLWVGGGIIAPIGLFLFACKARPQESRTHNKSE